jgi:hypothetical protein
MDVPLALDLVQSTIPERSTSRVCFNENAGTIVENASMAADKKVGSRCMYSMIRYRLPIWVGGVVNMYRLQHKADERCPVYISHQETHWIHNVGEFEGPKT